MAADYLQQIRVVQSQGPYFIGGYSIGGPVAYEMAQQLQHRGQEVGLLVLIDPTPPHLFNAAGQETPANSAESFGALQAQFNRLSQLGPSALVRVLWASLKWRSESFIELLKLQLCHAYLRFGRQIPSELQMPYFFEASGRATEKYRAKPYPGRVVLLSA